MHTAQVNVGRGTLTIETGKIAKQAGGAVTVRYGDTVVIVTACAAATAREGIDFLPLTVDYREYAYASGRIPGGFFKREGRLRASETLTSRIIDRSIRPLFSDGWACETQVIATVLSGDPEHPADSIALTGASLALGLSDMPFLGPIAGIRVGRVNGEFLANPSFELLETADINLFVASRRDAIVMVEGGGDEVSEQDMVDALLFAHEQAQPLLDVQHKMIEQAGKTKRELVVKEVDTDFANKVQEIARPLVSEAYQIKDKLPRYAALDAAKAKVLEILKGESEELMERKAEISEAISSLKYNMVRQTIIKDKKRILPCCAYLEGEFGINGLCVGVPVKLGSGGVEQIVEISLTESEGQALKQSAASVQELVDVMRQAKAEAG